MKKVNEVAEALRLNKYTIYKYIKEGKIKAVKLNRTWRIPDMELERVLREGTQDIRGSK
ncbi:MAG: helix-turn-helix domain-containing protein [Caldimicrobium sp.]